MNKKILLGSIFIIVLFLLTSSIQAIKQKTIEDNVYSDLTKRINALDDDIKLPTLKDIITLLIGFRFLRGSLLMEFATEEFFSVKEITYPLIYLRGCWLYDTSLLLLDIVDWRFNDVTRIRR